MPDVNESLKDLGYVAIGLGVLGFQRAQVRRRELIRQLREHRPELEAQVAEARMRLADLVTGLGDQLRPPNPRA